MQAVALKKFEFSIIHVTVPAKTTGDIIGHQDDGLPERMAKGIDPPMLAVHFHGTPAWLIVYVPQNGNRYVQIQQEQDDTLILPQPVLELAA